MSAKAEQVRALARSAADASGAERQEAAERLLTELRSLADARDAEALREMLADRVLENLTGAGGQSLETAALSLLRKVDPQAGFEVERARSQEVASSKGRVARLDGFFFASVFALSQGALTLLPLSFWHLEGYQLWAAARAGAAVLTGVGLMVSSRSSRGWSLAALVAAAACGASALVDAWRLGGEPHGNQWNLALLGVALCPAWASAALHALRGTAMRSWRGRLAVLASCGFVGGAAVLASGPWVLGLSAGAVALLAVSRRDAAATSGVAARR